MKRNTAVLCIITAWALSLPLYSGRAAATSPSLKYLWNAFVKITTTEGKVVFIDPCTVTDPDSADIVLITHEHSDHNDLTRITPKSTCRIIRYTDALVGGVYQVITIGNIRIEAVPAYNQYHPVESGVGFIVEFDGIKLYHAGGTGTIPEMANLAARDITYALFPTTNEPEAMSEAAALVNARHDIPIHALIPVDGPFNTALMARFHSPNRLIVLPGETIPLSADTTPHAGVVLRVPQEYSTIQSAIDTAQSPDTVLVSEGTYRENISFKGKSIVVSSRYRDTHDWNTVANTIIDGSGAAGKDTASTVKFLIGEDAGAVLDGFTITGGNGTKYMLPNGTGTSAWQEGAGIILHYSSATIRNNFIRSNTMVARAGVTNGGGGGISTMYGNPHIYNNVIVSNTSGYAGGIVLNWSGGRIHNNIVYHNSAVGNWGTGGIMVWNVPANSAFVENNTVIGNSSAADAGGINITPAGTAIPSVRNNIVWGNRQMTGGQITNPQLGRFNDVEDYSLTTNISRFPQFQEGTFVLPSTSPCVDAGDTAAGCSDRENYLSPGTALLPSLGSLRNDIGAYGGLEARNLPAIDLADLYLSFRSRSLQCAVGQQTAANCIMRNLSSTKFVIDSITQTNATLFSLSKDFSGRRLDLFSIDTLGVTFTPAANGTFRDTIRIYHSMNGIDNPIAVTVTGTGTGGSTDIQQDQTMGHTFRLYQNYPNPFNPSTMIRFELPEPSFVTVKVFDMIGREIATLVSSELPAGLHSCTWNAEGMANGVYFYRLKAGAMTVTNRLLLLK